MKSLPNFYCFFLLLLLVTFFQKTLNQKRCESISGNKITYWQRQSAPYKSMSESFVDVWLRIYFLSTASSGILLDWISSNFECRFWWDKSNRFRRATTDPCFTLSKSAHCWCSKQRWTVSFLRRDRFGMPESIESSYLDHQVIYTRLLNQALQSKTIFNFGNDLLNYFKLTLLKNNHTITFKM